MLSSLGPDGFARLTDQPERLREVNTEVEAMGVQVHDQYALLGPYDFLNILDAPDEATMAKVVTNLAARGTLKSVTLTAVPIDDYIAKLREE